MVYVQYPIHMCNKRKKVIPLILALDKDFFA
jgi:hypothetical protein